MLRAKLHNGYDLIITIFWTILSRRLWKRCTKIFANIFFNYSKQLVHN